MREEIATQAVRVVGVNDITGTRPQRGRHISTGELSALMTACQSDDSPAGVRDAAITALAWAAGARRSESQHAEFSELWAVSATL